MTLGDFIVADPAKVLSPDAARARILAAIDAARGNRTHAAKALGESQRNLLRVIEALDLWPAIDALCTERGYAVQPGPERGPRSPRRARALASDQRALRPTRPVQPGPGRKPRSATVA